MKISKLLKSLLRLNPILIIALILNLIGCQKENEEITNKKGTVTDIEGHIYKTITIGSQVWMAENLRVTCFNDSTQIPNITDPIKWINMTSGAQCLYENNEAYLDSMYGRFYNWYAVKTGKLAPKGWHVPTDEDWEKLKNYVCDNYSGGSDKVANHLKIVTGWDDYIGNYPDNETGFSGVPAGLRGLKGEYDWNKKAGYFWSSTEFNGEAILRNLDYRESTFVRGFAGNKNAGFSIRCIKD